LKEKTVVAGVILERASQKERGREKVGYKK